MAETAVCGKAKRVRLSRRENLVATSEGPVKVGLRLHGCLVVGADILVVCDDETKLRDATITFQWLRRWERTLSFSRVTERHAAVPCYFLLSPFLGEPSQR